MSRVETLEQRVDELEQRLKSLEKPKVNPTLNYRELHHILEDVALVYKGQRLPTSERPPQSSCHNFDDGHWVKREDK